MSTDLIKKIEETYSNKMKEIITETLKNSQNKKTWQKKKEAIAQDISNCFDHLIIPKDTLKKILSQSDDQCRQFQNIQIEILEELEKFLSDEIEKARTEQKEYIKQLDENINSLKEHHTTKLFTYTNETNDPLFISNNYLNERIDYLKEILTNNFPENFSLTQYKQSIEELFKEKILTDDNKQEADTDFKKKEELLKKIYSTYNILIRLKYILSSFINPETIFALGFVDNELFSKAETLHRIVLHHTQLFKDMIKELPGDLHRYFSLNYLYSKGSILEDKLEDNKQPNTDIFIYQRISDLDNIYFSQKQKDGLYLYNSDAFCTYWLFLRQVYKETFLLFPDIIPKKYTKTDIYINLIGNTTSEIANLFNISEAKFSRLKNNTQNITPKWSLLFKNFLDFDADFLKGTTTIPDLLRGHKDDQKDKYLIRVVSLARGSKRGILQAFKGYLDDIKQKLNQQKLNSEFSYLFKHLNLLTDNTDKLTEEDFKAIDHLLLLAFKAKGKKHL